VSHLLRQGNSVLKVISERPMILTSECRTLACLGEGTITTYFKHLRFDAAGPSGARTHDLPFAKREHYNPYISMEMLFNGELPQSANCSCPVLILASN
jgi:hypothetical protein